jgi:3-oxoadipate enol-lactonase
MKLQFDLWLHLARTDKIVFGTVLLVSGLSRDFLSAFDESTIDGIIRSFVAMSLGGEPTMVSLNQSSAV